MTSKQTEAVIKWVEDSGKRLTAVVSTHGHGDHWFGTAMLLKRFPEAKAYATAGTIEVMRFHGNPEFRASAWDKSFPGQIPESPILSTPAPGNVIMLEDHEVRFVEVGHSDTDKSSVIYVPSIGLVVADWIARAPSPCLMPTRCRSIPGRISSISLSRMSMVIRCFGS